MRKLILSLLLLPLAAIAATQFTPMIGVRDCEITGVSSATPAVVTVASLSACGLDSSSNGQQIWIWGVRNTNATGKYDSVNGHLTSSADTNGLCRVVASINTGANTFAVKACDGTTNVARSGTYSTGGRVAKGQFRTLTSKPRVFFDGLNGYVDTCIQSSAAGGCYESGRVERTALDALSGTLPDMTTPHRDWSASLTAFAALRWAAASKPGSGTYFDKMTQGMTYSVPIPTTACSGTNDCGYGASSYSDYAVETMQFYLFLFNYNLGFGQLGAGAKTSLLKYYFDDQEWSKGGLDYTGSTKTVPAFKTFTGTINWTAGSTSVTGNSTLFTTEVAVGDYLLIGRNTAGGYPRWHSVASITNNTTLVLSRAVDNEQSTFSTQATYLGRPWLEGTDAGFVAYSHYNTYQVLCGMAFNSSYTCPDYGDLPHEWEPAQNHTMGRIHSPILLGLTFSEDDPRAALLATNAMFVWYHHFQPQTLRPYGGIGAMSSSYHESRGTPLNTLLVGALQNSFTDAPDFLGGGTNSDRWWYEIGSWMLSKHQPGRNPTGRFVINNQNADFGCCADWNTSIFVNLFKPLNTIASALKYWMQTDGGTDLYSAAVLQASGNGGASAGVNLPWIYIANRPSVTATRSTQTSFITTAPLLDGCSAVWGSLCATDRRMFLASRSGSTAAAAWNGTGVALFYDWSSAMKRDHQHQIESVGPCIGANADLLLCHDGANGYFETNGGGNTLVLGSTSNYKTFSQVTIGVSSTLYGYSQPTLAAGAVNIADHFTGASGVTEASRGLLHVKGTGLGYFLMRDDWVSSGSLTASNLSHYWIGESCGTPSSSSCISLSRAAGTVAHTQTSTTTTRLNSKLYGTVDTENASNTNGSYTGGLGYTFRVTNSATGTSGSLYSVHQASTSSATTMPNIDKSTSGSHEVFEIDDGTSPVLAMIAPNATVNLTSCSATNGNANAQGVCTGLAPASYTWKLNGSDIPGCVGLTVASGSYVTECLDVDAGSVTVAMVASSAAGSRGGDRGRSSGGRIK